MEGRPIRNTDYGGVRRGTGQPTRVGRSNVISSMSEGGRDSQWILTRSSRLASLIPKVIGLIWPTVMSHALQLPLTMNKILLRKYPNYKYIFGLWFLINSGYLPIEPNPIKCIHLVDGMGMRWLERAQRELLDSTLLLTLSILIMYRMRLEGDCCTASSIRFGNVFTHAFHNNWHHFNYDKLSNQLVNCLFYLGNLTDTFLHHTFDKRRSRSNVKKLCPGT